MTLDKYNLTCENCGFSLDPEGKMPDASTFPSYMDYFDALDNLMIERGIYLGEREHKKADCIQFLKERIEKLEAKINAAPEK
jgi:hypothetical protein